MINEQDNFFLAKAIEIASQNIDKGGGPFGAIITENNEILCDGGNMVRINNDPTAHAEIEVIRKACKIKNSYSLENCTIYCSCEPCPMCLGAIYWAKISRIVFASSRKDAANAGFDDNFIYEEIEVDISNRSKNTIQIDLEIAHDVFKKWNNFNNKLVY